MSESTAQRTEVAYLCSYIESLIRNGHIASPHAERLRHHADKTCAVFGMVPVQEDDLTALLRQPTPSMLRDEAEAQCREMPDIGRIGAAE